MKRRREVGVGIDGEKRRDRDREERDTRRGDIETRGVEREVQKGGEAKRGEAK